MARKKSNIPFIDRFMAKVMKDPNSGCWLWAGGWNGKYGVFSREHGKSQYAHRLAYEELVGPIPDGLDIDHSCVTPLCVNPSHLSPMSRKENIRIGYKRRNGDRCHRGHPFTDENTKITKAGYRQCRRCRADKAYISRGLNTKRRKHGE
jgi:hypothetical protein